MCLMHTPATLENFFFYFVLLSLCLLALLYCRLKRTSVACVSVSCALLNSFAFDMLKNIIFGWITFYAK